MKLENALRGFLVQLEADGRSYHTRDQYRRHIGMLVRWLEVGGCSLEVEEVEHRDLARFLTSDVVRCRADGGPRKASSANALRSSLRTFFAHVFQAGLASTNAAHFVRLAHTGTPPPRSLSEAEEGRLRSALDNAVTWVERRDRVLLLTMADTGIRLSSALAILAADIDLGEGVIWLRQTKGDRPDRVFLPAATRRMLAEWMEEIGGGPVFATKEGRALGSRQAHRRFKFWLARSGITSPASPHWLRHGFAMRLYRRSKDILVVKKALLHRSLSSSLVYVHVSDERLREAMA